jgi:pilus assembly protein Flp/PilA
MSNFVSRFLKDESGATTIEYGVIVLLISVVMMTAVTSVGARLSSAFNVIP